jgi:hypothetical protein
MTVNKARIRLLLWWVENVSFVLSGVRGIYLEELLVAMNAEMVTIAISRAVDFL